MRILIINFIFFSLTTIFLPRCMKQSQLSETEKMQQFFAKDRVNILITDSGLGGLSVFADLAERIRSAGIFKTVNLIYFNAQPHMKSGYNSMKTTDQKIRVLENALSAMETNFEPDLLLIACNTLSVLYPETQYARRANIPVVGIVGTGVDLISEKIKNEKDASVIIFATKTTVEKDAHRQILRERGYDTSRFITQACPKLAGSIERGIQSEETKDLVDIYVNEALQKFNPGTEPFLVSLNCTHYGYVSDLFKQSFEKHGYTPAEMLDPNPFMVNFIFDDYFHRRYTESVLNLKVVSQSELPDDHIKSIGALIALTSPATHDALKKYKFTPELFEWRSITGDTGE